MGLGVGAGAYVILEYAVSKIYSLPENVFYASFTGCPKKSRILKFFGFNFSKEISFLKMSFLGVKIAEKHKSDVQKFFWPIKTP